MWTRLNCDDHSTIHNTQTLSHYIIHWKLTKYVYYTSIKTALLCVLVHLTFELLSVKWVWKYALGRQRRVSLPFYRSHYSRFKEMKWLGYNYLPGSDRSGWETQFFQFLFHYPFHSTSFPLKITGYERDFFVYCYFGLCRHSITGDTPHQHTPTSAQYSLAKTFFWKQQLVFMKSLRLWQAAVQYSMPLAGSLFSSEPLPLPYCI